MVEKIDDTFMTELWRFITCSFPSKTATVVLGQRSNGLALRVCNGETTEESTKRRAKPKQQRYFVRQSLHSSDKAFSLCPKNGYKYQTTMSDVKSAALPLVKDGRISRVWVSSDFANFGNRDAVDKTRRRMVCGGELRNIAR